MRLAKLLLIVALAACGGTAAPALSGSGTLTQEPDGGSIFIEADGGSCDCTGVAIPNFCEVCTNGSRNQCAHPVCVKGKCDVGLCD
jgi:hypothetical protein